MDEIVLELSEFQVSEVMNGLDIDAADHWDEPTWGRIEPIGPSRERGRLIIAGTQLARDRALYRITSSRDIWQDNLGGAWSQGERMAYQSGARSLSQLADRLIEAAGGREGFSPDFRRWI